MTKFRRCAPSLYLWVVLLLVETTTGYLVGRPNPLLLLPSTASSSTGRQSDGHLPHRRHRFELYGLFGTSEQGQRSSSVATKPPRSSASLQRKITSNAIKAAAKTRTGSPLTSKPPVAAPPKKTPVGATATTAENGIGGRGGYVYDVNRLKRNLMQETVAAYKGELWTLMLKHQTAAAGVTEWDVVDKLAALVQASPVRTTTDSNILDGSWCLAYSSQQSTTADLQRIMNLRERKKKRPRQLQQQQSRNGNTAGASVKTGLCKTTIRTFRLEDLPDDQDSYVEDCVHFFGGLLTRKRRSTVAGLTRTSLRLDDESSQWSVAGGYQVAYKDTAAEQRKRGKANRKAPADLQVVYCDADLCILTQEGGTNPKFHVFTKNEAWMDPQQRMQRKGQFLTASIQNFLLRFSPFGWIKTLVTGRKDDLIEADPILQEFAYESATLRVLKLGDLNESDDESWHGVQDPFVHLTADDRQKKLKSMSVRQIEKAGSRRSSTSWVRQLFRGRRKTYFKRPKDI